MGGGLFLKEFQQPGISVFKDFKIIPKQSIVAQKIPI